MRYHDFTFHEMQSILFAIERACLMRNLDQDNELGLAIRTHVTELIMECAEAAMRDPKLTLECALKTFESTIWSTNQSPAVDQLVRRLARQSDMAA